MAKTLEQVVQDQLGYMFFALIQKETIIGQLQEELAKSRLELENLKSIRLSDELKGKEVK